MEAIATCPHEVIVASAKSIWLSQNTVSGSYSADNSADDVSGNGEVWLTLTGDLWEELMNVFDGL